MDVIDRDLTIHELEAFRESCIANLLRMSFDDITDVVKDIPAVNRWISVEDALPEKTGYYLVCDSTAKFDNITGRQDVSKFVIGRHGGHWYGAIRREYITHWMPLPEPPEKE